MAQRSEASRLWRLVAIVFIIISIALLIALIVVSVKSSSNTQSPSTKLPTTECGASSKPAIDTAISTSPGLFDDLTSEEIQNVYKYMFSIESLNLKPNKDKILNSNSIANVRFYPPSKDKALEYLDQGKEKPERQAIVLIFKGALSTPVVEEYIVGPVSAPSKHELLRVKDRSYPIDFNERPAFSPQEENAIYEVIMKPMGTKLDRLLRESFDGYSLVNCNDKCFIYHFAAPFGLTKSTRQHWYYLLRAEDPYYLHPVKFQFYVNHTGSDSSKWRVVKVLYNGKLFNSYDELSDAYDNGKVDKVFVPAPEGNDEFFSTYRRRGNPQPAKPSRGPEQYDPDGKRYSVKGRHVKYMNWAFDFRLDAVSGLQVYDIRFADERIAYEISSQEVATTYGGYYPVASMTNYLDSSYFLGAMAYDLVPGVDCPGTATFFDMILLVYKDEPVLMKNSACVFEWNTGTPLRRHYDNDFMGGYNFYGGMANQALVLRIITAVANYDYIHDVIFYQNGVIEVKITASGYPMGSFYDDNVKPYAYPIHYNLSSNVHDHLFNYKVDLDVGGRENSYETIEVKTENVTNQWMPEINRYTVKKVLKRSTKKTELEAAYKYNFDHPKYLNFFNENKKNKFGTSKGYRIQMNGLMKQMYPEDWLMVPMMRWTLYQLAVTKYKDSERQSSSLFNQHSPQDPHIDFNKFLADNESIVNQDLVAWVTVGLLHIPHSEDVPNTATVGTSGGFLLRPFNYFDEDPSMGSTNAILIKPTDRKTYSPTYERYGTPTGPVCVPEEYDVTFYGRNTI